MHTPLREHLQGELRQFRQHADSVYRFGFARITHTRYANLARTSFQLARMWLGKTLGALDESKSSYPYYESLDPENCFVAPGADLAAPSLDEIAESGIFTGTSNQTQVQRAKRIRQLLSQDNKNLAALRQQCAVETSEDGSLSAYECLTRALLNLHDATMWMGMEVADMLADGRGGAIAVPPVVPVGTPPTVPADLSDTPSPSTPTPASFSPVGSLVGKSSKLHDAEGNALLFNDLVYLSNKPGANTAFAVIGRLGFAPEKNQGLAKGRFFLNVLLPVVEDVKFDLDGDRLFFDNNYVEAQEFLDLYGAIKLLKSNEISDGVEFEFSIRGINGHIIKPWLTANEWVSSQNASTDSPPTEMLEIEVKTVNIPFDPAKSVDEDYVDSITTPTSDQSLPNSNGTPSESVPSAFQPPVAESDSLFDSTAATTTQGNSTLYRNQSLDESSSAAANLAPPETSSLTPNDTLPASTPLLEVETQLADERSSLIDTLEFSSQGANTSMPVLSSNQAAFTTTTPMAQSTEYSDLEPLATSTQDAEPNTTATSTPLAPMTTETSTATAATTPESTAASMSATDFPASSNLPDEQEIHILSNSTDSSLRPIMSNPAGDIVNDIANSSSTSTLASSPAKKSHHKKVSPKAE